MRIRGWMLGLFGFVVLIGATALCATLSFGMTRQTVIDLWDSGIEVQEDEVGQLVNVLVGNTSAFPTAAPTEMVVSLDEPTAQPTKSVSLSGNPSEPTKAVNLAADGEEPTPTIVEDNSTTAIASVQEWNDPRQIRILLMGIDQRSAVREEGPFRTDTMMVVNIDPVRKNIGLISFPRDLWVDIPNFTKSRINTANSLGDANGYPGGGGPALAMDTISANFGIPVDRYIAINFDVFTTVTNILAPNGVEVCIDEYINDPHYPDAGYGTIEVTFQPGCQRLPAEQLLQYARTRATQGGDFDRARRQQQVLNAMLNELLSVGGIANFVAQAPNLWSQLSSSYRTNLSLDEILSLGLLVTEIGSDNVRSAVVDNLYVEFTTLANGDQVLIPNYSQITDLISRVFYPETEELDVVTLQARAQNENAAIYVYNGTDVSGLANETREWLLSKGVSVTGVGNDTNHSGKPTLIRDYDGNPNTARYLAELLGISVDRIQPGGDGLIAEGVMIVAGSDIQSLLASP